MEPEIRNNLKKVKLQRANGGCLGTNSRRRTCKAAKIHGELLKSLDPWESEWGNPMKLKLHNPYKNKILYEKESL